MDPVTIERVVQTASRFIVNVYPCQSPPVVNFLPPVQEGLPTWAWTLIAAGIGAAATIGGAIIGTFLQIRADKRKLKAAETVKIATQVSAGRDFKIEGIEQIGAPSRHLEPWWSRSEQSASEREKALRQAIEELQRRAEARRQKKDE